MTESGVLVVDKRAGVTSFDVVALVRRRLGVRRVGHAGTLDPAATGVLPVLVGEATKLAAYLMDHDKEYVVTVRFGVTTDTLDLEGRVLTKAPVPTLTVEGLRAACAPFVGRITQVPPMYSAVHHQGRRLYELAREGVEVDRAPRPVTIDAITVESVEECSATLRIVCGRGTYVRVLAADLGAALGCGAAVARLVRRRVGAFRLEDAVSWSVLSEAPAETLRQHLLPPERALDDWPMVRLDVLAAARFAQGQAVEVATLSARPGSRVRVHDGEGVLLGVAEVAGGKRVRPVRMLHADRPGPSVLPV